MRGRSRRSPAQSVRAPASRNTQRSGPGASPNRATINVRRPASSDRARVSRSLGVQQIAVAPRPLPIDGKHAYLPSSDYARPHVRNRATQRDDNAHREVLRRNRPGRRTLIANAPINPEASHRLWAQAEHRPIEPHTLVSIDRMIQRYEVEASLTLRGLTLKESAQLPAADVTKGRRR